MHTVYCLPRPALRALIPLSVLLLLTGLAASGDGRLQAAPTISLNPTSGPPGTSVRVTGSGWSNVPGEIRWDNVPNGTLLGPFQPNANGSFVAMISIPSNASGGAHTVWACQYCDGGPRPAITASAPFTVTGVITRPTQVVIAPTPRPLPTACDPRGVAGETVIDFESYALGARLDGTTTAEGIRFLGEDALVVFDPTVATRSPTRALMNDFAGREFGSINIPIRIGLANVADFAGVFVGLNEQIWADEPFTATLTAFGVDDDGHRMVVGTDSDTLGPAATPIRVCLSVEAPGRIFEVTIDYTGTGGVAEPEVIDDLILRGAEEPVPVPGDDLPPVVEIVEPEDGALVTEPYLRLQGEVTEDRELERVEVWLNDSLYRDIGFTPAGYTEEGDRRYLFALDPIPVSALIPCAINRLEVRAFDAAGNSGLDLSSIRSLVGDLEVVSAAPVQALYGAPLVQGKATAFRVRVNSTFPCPVSSSFGLDLPGSEWWSLPPATGRWVPAIHEGMAYPSVWGPVPIPANATDFEVMLPYVSSGSEATAWNESASPAGVLEGREAGGVYGPDVRVAPRPTGTQASFSVEIDPDDAIQETDEDNNQWISEPQDVFDTRGLHFYFVPWLFNISPQPGETESDYEFYLRESGYTDVAARLDAVQDAESRGAVALNVALSDDDIERLHREGTRFVEYFLGAFPIADSEISLEFGETMYFEDEYLAGRDINTCNSGDFSNGLNDMVIAAHPDIDMVILFRVMGCCGQSPGVYFDAGLELVGWPPDWHHLMVNSERSPSDRDYYCWDWTFPLQGAAEYTIGHELSHYLLGMPGECYDCLNPDHLDVDCAYCNTDVDGFWVNRWTPMPQGMDYMMESVCDGCMAWNRLEPSRKKNGAVNPDGYRHAIEVFSPDSDPDVLLVRGDLARSGEVAFEPFLILEEGTPDIRLGPDGDYFIVLLGEQGEELGRWGFSVQFLTFGPAPSLPVEIDSVHLSYRVEWQEGTRRIELQDREGNVLGSREVSRGLPEVRIVEPNGGDVWLAGRDYTVRWDASDPDGDPLSFSISLSRDGGESWTPLDIDLVEPEYRIRTDGFEPGGAYLVRILASDGVNTSLDVSDAAFQVVAAEPLRIPQLAMAGLVLLALVGVGMIVAAFLLRRAQTRR